MADYKIQKYACWANSKVFRIYDVSLAEYYKPIIKMFWSTEHWDNVLKLYDLTYYSDINQTVIIIDIGHSDSKLNIADLVITDKTKICALSKLAFMPRKHELVYNDLPMYAFCDGSLKPTRPATKNDTWLSISKLYTWACVFLKDLRDKKELYAHPNWIESLSVCEQKKPIDIPSSSYTENMGILESLRVHSISYKNTDYVYENDNIHKKVTTKSMPECGAVRSRISISESYDILLNGNPFHQRPLIIVCDNSTAISALSTNMHDGIDEKFVDIKTKNATTIDEVILKKTMQRLTGKKIYNYASRCNIAGMWIKGHPKLSEIKHMNELEKFFIYYNSYVDYLANKSNTNEFDWRKW